MLRTRLFFSLLPFVLILLVMGSSAIALFSRLARNVDVAVAGHYRDILVAQAMSQALAGMEREMQFSAVTRSSDSKLFSEYRARFEENLRAQHTNAVTAGMKDLNEQLTTNYHALVQLIGAPESLPLPRDPRKEQAISATVSRMYALLERVRDQNFRAVLDTSEGIQITTKKVTRLMVGGMALMLIIAAFTCFQLSRSILRPIRLLTRATRELGEGHPAQPVPVVTQDELGELAVSFNRMAAQLEVYRQSTSDQIVRLHRTMETTLASFPDPIFVLNLEGLIELKNPAADALAGGLRLNGQLPEPLQTFARKALESGQNYLPHRFDQTVAFRLNSIEKSFMPRILAMRTKENTLFGVAVVLHDVTRFRLLDSAKSNLVATVSHELNTPLTSVRMALHLLLEESLGGLTSKQNELLQAARNDTERLLRILNDLLDLARLEEDSQGLRKEAIAPLELLRGVAEQTADQAAARGVKIKYDADPDLPQVAVDRQRIGHVFHNLISNAVKYSPADGEVVLKAARAEDNYIEFSITDQGIGIPEEYQTRIFERFFRAPGQTKTGAGLGLSIAREITVAHGGRIGVQSSPGKGSTFTVTLQAIDQAGIPSAASAMHELMLYPGAEARYL